MKRIFQRLFGKRPSLALPVEDTAGATATDSVSTIEDGSDHAMRRQLMLLLLRDLMRRHGMPPVWIELQMLVVSSARRGEGLYVRLVMKQWDERLIHHAQAFQNELLADLARFEPQFDSWMRGISWQLEMTDSCPYTELPGKTFWEAQAPRRADQMRAEPAALAPLTAKVLSDSEAATDDLHALFRIRDQELRDAAARQEPLDYQPTQPLPLGR